MAVEVGIVGLPKAGKTTLFTALTKAETHGSGKEHVGMARSPTRGSASWRRSCTRAR